MDSKHFTANKLGAAVAVLAALLLAAPASGILPAAVPTKVAAGGQGNNVFSYTDPNTGSTAHLVARDGALWCDWSLVHPSSYTGRVLDFVWCAVKPLGGDYKDCKTDSMQGNGAAVGSCPIAASFPSTNLQWWISGTAMEVYMEDHTKRETTDVQITQWKLGYEVGLDATASFSFGGASGGAPVMGSGSADFSLSFSAGWNTTSYYREATTTGHYMRHREATVLGLNGAFVNTMAGIESLTIEGANYGCDALNIVETAKGIPRQIGTYTNRLQATTLRGTLETDLSHTILKDITNPGKFRIENKAPHRFEATYKNDGSSGADAVDAAGALASVLAGVQNPGLKGFDSAVVFTADYEVPEVPITFKLWDPQLDTSTLVRIQGVNTPSGPGAVATRADGLRQALITPATLEEVGGSLADAVGKALYDSAPGRFVFKDWDCPPKVPTANGFQQRWNSKATAVGYSSTTAISTDKDLTVYLDMGPY